ncbi:hypothetical protein AZE42_13348 [Rhizopogon vesiculosus]|uniref:Uncharacterized protein n=1 Tax=Rhizopogon vesiculosus TaxID=180088 RepID=A0A1J8PQ83_9AGAM|nr:hypothetical protein AZE42_13348 [Rhizopogon vesiculosus]
MPQQAAPPSRHCTSPLPDLTDEDVPMPAKPLPTTDETTPASPKAKKGGKKTARTTIDAPRRTSGRRRSAATRRVNYRIFCLIFNFQCTFLSDLVRLLYS